MLSDVGSRTDWDGQLAKHLPIPEGPILDFINKLFSNREEQAKAAEEVKQRRAEMGRTDWTPIPRTLPKLHHQREPVSVGEPDRMA